EEYRRRMDEFNAKHPSDDGWRAIHAWFCKERNKLQWERWRLEDEAGARLIAGYYADTFDLLFGQMK
ncbi:MAG: hypothetical protein II650_06945, partial [Clostridia bacterium]|nr:hypothetical protein [Clostridia bacterium]